MYISGGETCVTQCWPERGYVIKQFRPRKPKFGRSIDPLRDTLELSFYREVTCLERLHGHERFPQLLEHDADELRIKMSWVGRPFLHFASDDRRKYLRHSDDIVSVLEDLEIDVAYEWTPGDGRIGYCLSMMMVDGQDLNLIDFERAWPRGCDRESEFNTLFRSSFDGHSNDRFRSMLKETITTTVNEPAPENTYETE